MLARTLRASPADVRGWRPRPLATEGVFLRRARAKPEPAPPMLADDDEEQDEIDVLFLEGGDGN